MPSFHRRSPIKKAIPGGNGMEKSVENDDFYENWLLRGRGCSDCNFQSNVTAVSIYEYSP